MERSSGARALSKVHKETANSIESQNVADEALKESEEHLSVKSYTEVVEDNKETDDKDFAEEKLNLSHEKRNRRVLSEVKNTT